LKIHKDHFILVNTIVQVSVKWSTYSRSDSILSGVCHIRISNYCSGII